MRTGSTLVRVLPNPGGGWDVREPGSTRALSHAAEEDEAVVRARAMMPQGGVVQVLDHGGFMVKTYTAPRPGKGPWWYVQPRPLLWVVGGLLLLQGILGVVTTVYPGEYRFWLGLVMGMMGGLYLALVVASRRRDRRLMLRED